MHYFPFRNLINFTIKSATFYSRRHMSTMIVGLGNYQLPKTRHNIGMVAVECLAEKLQANWKYCEKCCGEIATCKINGEDVILLKPRLAMNTSGKSIVRTAKLFEVQPVDIIVLHDDLDRPLGKISIKHGGSASGHNGVKSAMAYLGSDVFRRLRIGIGRPPQVHQVVSFVLEEFEDNELNQVQDSLNRTVDIIHNKILQACRPQG